MTIELVLLPRVSYRGGEITSPRLRDLVALLAADLRTGSSTARLIEGLWPDEQPENPTKALQVLVSRTRAQLGSGVVVSTPTGYRLALTEDEVDSSAVLRCASAAAQHARAGDHAAALAEAEAGLALWEGAGDGDTGLDDPLSALRTERSSTYRSLVRARSLALSRLGRHEEAVDLLIGVFRERPRDEEALLELLRCEAATAGPSAALARYEAYRGSLRDELGTDPGRLLQALHQELLHGDAPAVRHGVPHEPNPLLGRDDDLAAVTALLHSARVTSIVGPGGLGKTRLAQVVSRQATQRVVHFVALAGVTADDDVMDEVASAIGVGESRPAPAGHPAVRHDVLAGMAAALGSGPALLVLDNCEHVVEGAAELVRAMVSVTEDVRVLTTSRAPLGLSSESVYALPELDLRTTVELFEQRARAARPGIELPADAVEELCRRLDGLPLAVELAAARVRAMSVDEIARGLDDRFSLLRGGTRDAPERHRTLHAVVDWSWNLLGPADQAAMRALSIFPGGFTAGAARQLLGESDVVRLLEDLVDQSLLRVADSPSGTRMSMLETVREFSMSRRDEADETEQVVDGFLVWARDFGMAHHDSAFGSDPAEAAERIRAEHDNLMLALRYGITRADGATVAATSAVLAGLWLLESNFTRLASLAGENARVLSHFQPPPEFVEVTRTASAVSVMTTFLLLGPRAARSLVTLRRLPPAPPDTLIRAAAVVLRATPEMTDSDHTTLRALCDSEEPLVSGIASGIAAYVWERENDLEGALKAARRMLEVFDDPRTPWMRVMARTRAGELCLQAELPAEARRHLEAALVSQEQLGQHSDRVGIRGGLAVVNLHLGELDEAERWLEAAVRDQPDDDVAMVAYGIGVRAEISLARGETEAGLALWRQAFEDLRTAGSSITGGDPGMDPWHLEVQAVVVGAHAHHGRLDLVEQTTGDLAQKLSAMLLNPAVGPPAYVMDLPACGALMLALAMVDIDRAERTGDKQAARSGAQLVALAESFRFARNFQPTMSATRARATAEQADRQAYAEAGSSYAGLSGAELRAAALAVLRERDQVA